MGDGRFTRELGRDLGLDPEIVAQIVGHDDRGYPTAGQRP
jgi:hypothetical protein